jgi:hypothetical protein
MVHVRDVNLATGKITVQEFVLKIVMKMDVVNL